jgi:hypothetical protein
MFNNPEYVSLKGRDNVMYNAFHFPYNLCSDIFRSDKYLASYNRAESHIGLHVKS